MKLEGFLVVLTIVLLGLKLFAGLAITWFWVFAPLILVAVIAVVALIFLIVCILLAKDVVLDKVKEELKK